MMGFIGGSTRGTSHDLIGQFNQSNVLVTQGNEVEAVSSATFHALIRVIELFEQKGISARNFRNVILLSLDTLSALI